MLISISANEFFSLVNKKDPVKKAAVQFVDKSWGKCKKKKKHTEGGTALCRYRLNYFF